MGYAYDNHIYYKEYDGYGEWIECNNNRNCIYLKDSNGYEEWREGNIVHYRDSEERGRRRRRT